MEEDLRVRFKEVLRFYKSNINQLSKGDKAMQVRLSRQINNGATITFETVSNILDTFPDVSAEWLLRGKGEMLIASSPNEKKEEEALAESLFRNVLVELMSVYNATFPDAPHLELAKDVFCFQCFTSLRYSDVRNLKKADIYDGYLTTTTIKTDEPLKIELNKYSKAILEKYKDIEGIYALPVPVNQRMNKYIKDICKACEINEPICRTYYKGAERIDEIHPKYELIGTHCGRKTFICNALMLGIAPNIVMKWTGHRDYKSMKPYIDIADKAKEEAMNLFNR